MASGLCGIPDRLAQLIDVLLGIVVLLLPQVQESHNLVLVFGTGRERRRAAKQADQDGLELAADRRVARAILGMVEDIVDEVEDMQALSPDRGLALGCWAQRGICEGGA